MTTTLTTAEPMGAPTTPLATTGDIAASPAALYNDDDDVDDGRLDGDTDSTDGDEERSCGITCRIGARTRTTLITVELTLPSTAAPAATTRNSQQSLPLQATLKIISTTSEATVASTAPTATTGDLAASSAAPGDIDNDVKNDVSGGGIARFSWPRWRPLWY